MNVVHLCYLDSQVVGPDTLVVRVALRDDPDRPVYVHANQEAEANSHGRIVDSGLLIDCERRRNPSLGL